MRSLLLLSALALAGAPSPPVTADQAILNLNRAHACEWSPEDMITIADRVKAITIRSPLAMANVVDCLGRLVTAIRNQGADLPEAPALLDALEEVVKGRCAGVF